MKKAITTTTILTFSALVLIAISIFAYRIISSSIESKNRENSYVEQCCINATEYVKEKYGFEAEIISSMYPTNSNYSHSAYIKMEYNDKRFYVYITGEEKSTDGYDNYQAEEIKNSLNQKLIDITGIQHEAMVIDYGMYDYHSVKLDIDYLTSEYFDGNNLKDVLMGINYVNVIYINQDTFEIATDEIIQQTGIYVCHLYNCDSKEHYYEGDDTFGVPYHTMPDLRYVNDYCTLSSSQNNYYKCTKAEYDDVIVVTDQECTRLELKKGNSDPASKWYKSSINHPIKVSKTYALDTDASQVYIYFPLKNINFMRSEANFAYQYTNDGNNYHCDTSGIDKTADKKYSAYTLKTEKKSNVNFLMLLDLDIFIQS